MLILKIMASVIVQERYGLFNIFQHSSYFSGIGQNSNIALSHTAIGTLFIIGGLCSKSKVQGMYNYIPLVWNIKVMYTTRGEGVYILTQITHYIVCKIIGRTGSE